MVQKKVSVAVVAVAAVVAVQSRILDMWHVCYSVMLRSLKNVEHNDACNSRNHIC
jgi:hypothetical protein